MPARDRAADLLVHYFRAAFEGAGLNWDYDNRSEVEQIVDAIAAMSAEAVEAPPRGRPASVRRREYGMTINLDEVAADLQYASSGIDGGDLPYIPHALAAMRAAENLLAEVQRLRAAAGEVLSIANRLDDGGLAAVCDNGDDLPTILRRAIGAAA